MRIVAISNLHGYCPYDVELPQGDILVLAGGLLPIVNQPPSILNIYQYLHYKCELLPWIRKMSKRYKSIIGTWGFSDRLFYQQRYYRLHDLISFELALPDNVFMMIDNFIKINGAMFYCSPWTSDGVSLAFNETDGGLLNRWDRIHPDTDVLITAEAARYAVSSAVGCQRLYNKVLSRPKIKAHIFGHLHSNMCTVVNSKRFISPSFTKASTKNTYIPNTEAIQYFDLK